MKGSSGNLHLREERCLRMLRLYLRDDRIGWPLYLELSLLIGNHELLVERGVPLVDYRPDPIIFGAIRPYFARDILMRRLLSLILKVDGRWLQRYILL
jgi:hypothetical protein